jgi:hypothetical protein
VVCRIVWADDDVTIVQRSVDRFVEDDTCVVGHQLPAATPNEWQGEEAPCTSSPVDAIGLSGLWHGVSLS